MEKEFEFRTILKSMRQSILICVDDKKYFTNESFQQMFELDEQDEKEEIYCKNDE